MFWSMLLMNWCKDYACWWIGDESCCCWIFKNIWWIVEFWQNGVWILSFEHHWVCVHVYMPINIIWDVFWVWKDQNWSVWEKWFWNSKFFFLDWRVFAQASSKRTSSERAQFLNGDLCNIVHLIIVVVNFNFLLIFPNWRLFITCLFA